MVQKEIIDQYSKGVVKKASQIKAIFFDVDGVLTDGKIIYDSQGGEIKEFHVRDGLIIGHLKKAGILIGAISGRESVAVSHRSAELKFDFCHQAIEDKAWVCRKIMKHHKLKPKQVAFLGDDINDLGIFKVVGFTICPSDSANYIKARVDLVTFAKGGRGVLREVADLILAAKGSFGKLLK